MNNVVSIFMAYSEDFNNATNCFSVVIAVAFFIWYFRMLFNDGRTPSTEDECEEECEEKIDDIEIDGVVIERKNRSSRDRVSRDSRDNRNDRTSRTHRKGRMVRDMEDEYE